MKFAIIIPDGCSDEPQSTLDGRTPLEVANIPAVDEIAKRGFVGRTNFVPAAFDPGSAVANMSLLGYDPNVFYSGRAPIEAVAQNVSLGPNDWAVRCNLVSVEGGIMKSFTAGQYPSDLAKELLAELQHELQRSNLAQEFEVEFIPGVSYRNMLICRGNQPDSIPFDSHTRTVPPHDLTDQSIQNGLPTGSGSEWLRKVMEASRKIFANHSANQKRSKLGQTAATDVWLWGLGKTPKLGDFQERFGKRGAMITAVDLLRGLAKLVGWSVLEVPGATGYLDTNYAGKGQAAVDALEAHDIVIVHVEATDEASHEGDAQAKIEALESIDQHIIGPLLGFLQKQSAWRILVTPDHPTFLRTKTHSRGYVPVATCGTGLLSDDSTAYSENSAQRSNQVIENGHELMPRFLNPESTSFIE